MSDQIGGKRPAKQNRTASQWILFLFHCTAASHPTRRQDPRNSRNSRRARRTPPPRPQVSFMSAKPTQHRHDKLVALPKWTTSVKIQYKSPTSSLRNVAPVRLFPYRSLCLSLRQSPLAAPWQQQSENSTAPHCNALQRTARPIKREQNPLSPAKLTHFVSRLASRRSETALLRRSISLPSSVSSHVNSPAAVSPSLDDGDLRRPPAHFSENVEAQLDPTNSLSVASQTFGKSYLEIFSKKEKEKKLT